MSNNEILQNCIDKTEDFKFLSDNEKEKLKERLEHIQSIKKSISVCGNPDCEFQMIIYTYSVIELLVNSYLGLNTNPNFHIPIEKSYIFDFLPNNLPSCCNKLRKYRNYVHLNALDAEEIKFEDAINYMLEVFQYLLLPSFDKPELIELIHSVDLSNENDCQFLEKHEMNIASIKSVYKDFINEKGILSLPFSIDKDYKQFLGKFILMFEEIYTSDATQNYSYWLKNGIRKSIDLFDKNSLTQMIATSSKKMDFYYNCDDSIDFFVYNFSDEIIQSIKSNYFIIDSSLNNINWIASLLYSLMAISNDENIYDVLECVLIIYEKSSFAQAFDMASDMLWPSSPQTAACLNKQKEAIRSLFNLKNKVNRNTKNELLLNLIKGKKQSCTVYRDQNNKYIGLFEDGGNHFNDIADLYKYYLGFLLSVVKHDLVLLHTILKSISSFDKDVSCRLLKFTMANINCNNISDDIYKDLIIIKNSDFLRDDEKKQFADFVSNIEAHKKEDKILEVAIMFNQTGKITDEGKATLLNGNLKQNLFRILDNLKEQDSFGFYVSETPELNEQFNKVVKILLCRDNDIILKFLKGYFCNNAELVNNLYNDCEDENIRVNLLMLLKLDESIISKIDALRNDSQHIYWSNFTINNIIDFCNIDRNAYIIKEEL